MGFQKGHPRFGGRKKGAKNLRLGSSAEVFEQHNFNALEKAIELFRDESVELPIRVAILKELLKYQYPQLRAVEHSGNVNSFLLEDHRNQLVQVFSDPVALKAAKAIAERLNIEESEENQSASS